MRTHKGVVATRPLLLRPSLWMGWITSPPLRAAGTSLYVDLCCVVAPFGERARTRFMAKGNAGNLLQHGIEVELGCALADRAGGSPLTVTFTHAMAPFELCQQRSRNGQKLAGTKLLERWLDWPYATAGRPRIAEAYRRCRASVRRYPNSAELLAAMLGRHRLRGHLFETEPTKVKQLHGVWAGSNVVPHLSSWRDGICHVVDEPPGPWLLSMDPDTFVADGWNVRDREVGLRDLQLVENVVSGFFGKGISGALLVFCYKLDPARQKAFKAAMRAVFERKYPGVEDVTFVETTPIGHDRHIGAIVTNEAQIGSLAERSWQMLQRELE